MSMAAWPYPTSLLGLSYAKRNMESITNRIWNSVQYILCTVYIHCRLWHSVMVDEISPFLNIFKLWFDMSK